MSIEAESLGDTFKWKFTSALRLSITVYPSASFFLSREHNRKPFIHTMINGSFISLCCCHYSFHLSDEIFKSTQATLPDSMPNTLPKFYYPWEWALKSLTKGRINKCFDFVCARVFEVRVVHRIHTSLWPLQCHWVHPILSRWGRKNASSATIKRGIHHNFFRSR